MNCSTLGLPVHHQLLEFTQTHVHWVGVAIQPSHPLLSPSPPALSLSQHQGPLKCVSSLHQVAKVLEFQQKPVCYCHSSFICNSNKLERARILCSRCMVKTAVLHPQGSSASSPQEVAVVRWWVQTKSPKLRIPRGHALCCSRVGSGGLWAGSREGGTLRAILQWGPTDTVGCWRMKKYKYMLKITCIHKGILGEGGASESRKWGSDIQNVNLQLKKECVLCKFTA